MQQVGRLLRTVAHLAPSQVWHRLRLDVQNAVWERSGRRIDARYRARAARLPTARFDLPGMARLAALRAGRSSDSDSLTIARDALEGRFSFLGVTHDLGRDVDWFRPDLDRGTRLWKTLLHEFPFAIDLARAARSTGTGAVFEPTPARLAGGCWRVTRV